MSLFCQLNNIRSDSAITCYDQASDVLIKAIDKRFIVTIADKYYVIFADNALYRLQASSSNTNIATYECAFITVHHCLRIQCADDIAEPYTRISQVLHAKLLEVPIRKVADRDHPNEFSLAVSNRNGL